MPYCTQSDILEQLDESELIQLTDDDDLGVVDVSVVTRAIADADAEIDGYCGTRYTVPFATVPDIIRKFSVDVAIYNLYARRRGAPEDRKQRYDAALRFLRDIAKGVASLGVNAPADDDDSGPAVTTSKSDRVFTRGRSSDNSSGSLDNF
jgi:phage gp36-like protein